MPRKPKTENCQIIAQAVLSGPQEAIMRVFGRNDGWDQPYISLRVGRLLINIQDHAALTDLSNLIREANRSAERAFGPAPAPATIPGRRR
jgi:hypothetical protein